MSLLNGVKFHLGKHSSGKNALKNIKLDKLSGSVRDFIALFGDNISVGFFNEMIISFLCEREIIFFMRQKPLSFISEPVFFVVAPYSDDRLRAQITLFNLPAFVL